MNKIAKLIPTLNRIIVKKIEQQTKTASGIILNDTSANVQYGVVVSTGPGLLNEKGTY